VTGEWEQRLRNIAYGTQFSMPAASKVIESMDELTPLLDKAAQDPGITGTTGLAAADSLKSVSQRASAVSTTTADLHTAVTQANNVRGQAQADLESLGSGNLNWWQEAAVRTAAVGATIAFPGFSVVAGEGAVDLVNWFLGNKREEDAKAAVKKASDAFDDIYVPEKVETSKSSVTHRGSVPGGTTPGGSGPRSFDNYPGASTPGIDPGHLPKGLTLTGTGTGSGAGSGNAGSGFYQGPGVVTDDYTPVVYPPGQTGGVGGSGDSDGVLTPNGPNAGGTTWGGGSGLGSGAGSGLGSGSGFGSGGSGYGAGGSGLLGSAATGGAVAGTSGAALFGGARLAGGGLGAAGAGGAMGGGTAGGAVGAGGMGGAGGAGGRGAAAGKSGGLLGGTRSGAGAAKSASSSTGAASGGRGGMAGGGAPGGRGRAENKQEGRGLGGPIAPHLEDDEERGPRSAAAGAGGRE